MDQTGRLPINERNTNNYVCPLYNYDTNTILTDNIKNWNVQEILRDY